MKILGVDPGGVTGLVVVERLSVDVIVPLYTGQIASPNNVALWSKLNQIHAIHSNLTDVVCEDFILQPHSSDDMRVKKEFFDTCKQIGWVQAWAHTHKLRLTMQRNTCLTLGAAWSGNPVKKSDKRNHEKAALAHAFYFARTHGQGTQSTGTPGKPKRPVPPWK